MDTVEAYFGKVFAKKGRLFAENCHICKIDFNKI